MKKPKKDKKRFYSLDERLSIYNTLLECTESYDGNASKKAFFHAVAKDVNDALDKKFELDGNVLQNFHQNGLKKLLENVDRPFQFDNKTEFTPTFVGNFEKMLAEVEIESEEEDNMRELWQYIFKIEVFLRLLKTRKSKKNKEKKRDADAGKEGQAQAYAAAVLDQANGVVTPDKIEVSDEETDRKKKKKRKSKSAAELEESVTSLSESRVHTAQITAESQERIVKMQLEASERAQKNQTEFVERLMQAHAEESRRRDEENRRREEMQMKFMMQLMEMKKKDD